MKERTIRALLFDFDGTLTKAGLIDFAGIRSAIGCPPGASILAHLERIADPKERERAERRLGDFELAAAERAEEQPGAAELVRFARSRALKLGVITRNSRESVDRSFSRLKGLAASDFDVIVTRDDAPAPKPSPEGVLHACAVLGVPPAEVMVVGDYRYDIEAGRSAGAVTVLLGGAQEPGRSPVEEDHRIGALSELIGIIEGIPPPGASTRPSPARRSPSRRDARRSY